MSSTISTKDLVVGSKFYVPFWILLEFLDTAPPNPFIEVEILSVDIKYATDPNGPVEVYCCDLICDRKRQLIAHSIPADYLIAPDDLREWANKIANWFRDFDSI